MHPLRGGTPLNQQIKEEKIVGTFTETVILAAKPDGPLRPYEVTCFGITDGPKLFSNLSREFIGAGNWREMQLHSCKRSSGTRPNGRSHLSPSCIRGEEAYSFNIFPFCQRIKHVIQRTLDDKLLVLCLREHHSDIQHLVHRETYLVC